MGADLISIANSGARAAKVALDVTANNIANASSEGYIRRTVSLSELSSNTIAAAPTVVLKLVAICGSSESVTRTWAWLAKPATSNSAALPTTTTVVWPKTARSR